MGTKPEASIVLSDEVIQMTAFKKAEHSEDYIIRLFEPTGEKRTTVISIPAAGIQEKVELDGFEIRTLKLDVKAGLLYPVDLLERKE
jgi:alpha-mannosidase